MNRNKTRDFIKNTMDKTITQDEFDAGCDELEMFQLYAILRYLREIDPEKDWPDTSFIMNRIKDNGLKIAEKIISLRSIVYKMNKFDKVKKLEYKTIDEMIDLVFEQE